MFPETVYAFGFVPDRLTVAPQNLRIRIRT